MSCGACRHLRIQGICKGRDEILVSELEVLQDIIEQDNGAD